MLKSIWIVSSGVVCSTMIFWNLRSKAPSFSIVLRYSSRVVAPMHCIVPRAKAGFSIFAASILPDTLPAPMMVCISSMKQMMSGFVSSSLMRFFRRSSNCPRYFVPATNDAISRDTRRLLKSIGDTLLSAIN